MPLTIQKTEVIELEVFPCRCGGTAAERQYNTGYSTYNVDIKCSICQISVLRQGDCLHGVASVPGAKLALYKKAVNAWNRVMGEKQ